MSTLQVDKITPYLSASVTIEGSVIQADAATTGSNTFQGNQIIVGTGVQTFNDPSNGVQIDNLKVNSWAAPSGHTIGNSTLGWQRYDGTVHGWAQELYTSDYSYGSVVFHEPSKIHWGMFPSGAAYQDKTVDLIDNGDTTATFRVATNKIELTGSIAVSGNQFISGQGTQTFSDISNNSQVDNIKIGSWVAPAGYTIANSTLGWQRYDGTVHGFVQELYTADYAYGSSVRHEPGAVTWEIFASGSAYSGGSFKLEDKGDTSVNATFAVDVADIQGVLQLKDWAGSLPGGSVGQLAVSNNNLYYHNGTSWTQLN